MKARHGGASWPTWIADGSRGGTVAKVNEQVNDARTLRRDVGQLLPDPQLPSRTQNGEGVWAWRPHRLGHPEPCGRVMTTLTLYTSVGHAIGDAYLDDGRVYMLERPPTGGPVRARDVVTGRYHDPVRDEVLARLVTPEHLRTPDGADPRHGAHDTHGTSGASAPRTRRTP